MSKKQNAVEKSGKAAELTDAELAASAGGKIVLNRFMTNALKIAMCPGPGLLDVMAGPPKRNRSR